MVRLEGPLVAGAIDWNNDGNTTGKGFSQDLSFNGQLDAALMGFNDWGNLDLQQIGARPGVFGFSGDVWGTLDDGSGGTLDDGSGGTLDDGSGGTLDDGSGGTLDDGSGGTLDDGSGGTLDDGSGGRESDLDQANSTVDPPNGVSSALVRRSVVLNWSAPGFGQIRTYTIWRADTTNAPISPTNLPVNIGKVTGTPPVTNEKLKQTLTFELKQPVSSCGPTTTLTYNPQFRIGQNVDFGFSTSDNSLPIVARLSIAKVHVAADGTIQIDQTIHVFSKNNVDVDNFFAKNNRYNWDSSGAAAAGPGLYQATIFSDSFLPQVVFLTLKDGD